MRYDSGRDSEGSVVLVRRTNKASTHARITPPTIFRRSSIVRSAGTRFHIAAARWHANIRQLMTIVATLADAGMRYVKRGARERARVSTFTKWRGLPWEVGCDRPDVKVSRSRTHARSRPLVVPVTRANLGSRADPPRLEAPPTMERIGG